MDFNFDFNERSGGRAPISSTDIELIQGSAGGSSETDTGEEFYNALQSTLKESTSNTTQLPPASANFNLEDHTESGNNNFIPNSSMLNLAADNHSISSSFSRRRAETSSSKRSFSTSSLTATSSSATSSSAARIRQRSNNSMTSDTSIIEEGETNAGGLRSSLDSGMAGIRRWVLSRSSSRARSANAEAGNIAHTRFIEEQHIHGIGNAAESSVCDSVSLIQQQGHHLSAQRDCILTDVEENQHNNVVLEYDNIRGRSKSETDSMRIRDSLFQRALYVPQRIIFRRRNNSDPPSGSRQRVITQQLSRSHGNSEIAVDTAMATSTSRLSASAAEALHSSNQNSARTAVDRAAERGNYENPGIDSPTSSDSEEDRRRDARNHWLRINRRFQVVISVFSFIFSLLLLSIILCWVVLTSAYVVSIEDECDVPLKLFFWLATVQLVVDVFRNDIIRVFLCWDTNSTQRMPCRVILYNASYLIYALVVLRLGVYCVFIESTTCNETASQLFLTSSIFVTLCLAAWGTIVIGYLLPFCVVAALLTTNRYIIPPPVNRRDNASNPFSMFSSAAGAPPGCIDELAVIHLQDFPVDYPRECCICIENFAWTEMIVETECCHVFHKECCREWLKQARTCPMCRTEIATEAEHGGAQGPSSSTRRPRRPSRVALGRAAQRSFGRNDLHDEMMSLLQTIRRHERRQRSQAGQ